MKYWQSTVLHRWLVFQGVAYDVGLSVDSSITWNVWCFGYEFDVIARDRRFLGVILEANYTNIRAELESAVAYEYARVRAPIPAIGAIGRVYISRFTPITAEFTAFRLPNNMIEDYTATYVDFDIYGTVNLTRMVGINLGYRSMDLRYLFDRYAGHLQLGRVVFLGCSGSSRLRHGYGEPRPAAALAGCSLASRRSASSSVASRLQKQKRTLVRPRAGSW